MSISLYIKETAVAVKWEIRKYYDLKTNYYKV